ncbi:c-type cytochrome [Limobrevibacterium gyesilva]|uniref:Cytochrome c n=1 Tax=Limobrevibacterium gyesilva TaxID=2991712 RepID=A0AA41YSN6_9PROT|nr:cytochrome c [Limobrevibacterium gyesilva]
MSGIGAWSRAGVVEYLRNGAAPDRAQAAGPMAAAVEALAAWLASQPPVRDPADQIAASARGKPLAPELVPRGIMPAHLSAEQGGAVLYNTSCASCHGATGAGDGYFPSLYHNTTTGHRDPSNLIAVLLNGVQRTTAATGVVFMPGFDGSVGMPGGLSDAELATLANFVLTQFGDPAAAKVTVADIAASRAGQ